MNHRNHPLALEVFLSRLRRTPSDILPRGGFEHENPHLAMRRFASPKPPTGFRISLINSEAVRVYKACRRFRHQQRKFVFGSSPCNVHASPFRHRREVVPDRLAETHSHLSVVMFCLANLQNPRIVFSIITETPGLTQILAHWNGSIHQVI